MPVEEIVQYCLDRHEDLKSERSTYEENWEDISRFIIPNSGDFNGKRTAGAKRRRYILDGTGEWASNQLANFLYGALTNPATDWFALGVYNPDLARRDDVRQFLTYANAHMYSVFNNPKKKFYDHSHELYTEIVPFGTGILMAEDRPGSGLHFRARSLREFYLDEDVDGMVDVACREFEMSSRNLVATFGDKVGDDVKKAAEKSPSRKWTVLHCIYPKTEYNSAVRTYGPNMPYASVYILKEKKLKLREGGFRRFPIQAPRWMKRADEIYGQGPGSVAISSIRMLQKMKETTLKGGQKVVDPPLQIPHNAFMAPLNLTPGAINIYNPVLGDQGAKPIQTDSRPDFGLELMQEEKEAILRAFYADKLSSQKNPNVEQTRSEFLGEQQERLILMAPQLGRMHTEYIGPLVEQAYYIERITNRMAEPPEVLQNEPFVVQYKSPLAKAQQLQKLQSVTGAVQDLVPMAQVYPEILDGIDPDRLAEYIFINYDTPSDILRPEEQVAQLREQRQQQQQAQQIAETAETGSKAVANIAKAQGGGLRAVS